MITHAIAKQRRKKNLLIEEVLVQSRHARGLSDPEAITHLYIARFTFDMRALARARSTINPLPRLSTSVMYTYHLIHHETLVSKIYLDI
jgi:hypothetical protein